MSMVEYIVTAQFHVIASSAEAAVNKVRNNVHMEGPQDASLIAEFEDRLISGTVPVSREFVLEQKIRRLKSKPKGIINITAARNTAVLPSSAEERNS